LRGGRARASGHRRAAGHGLLALTPPLDAATTMALALLALTGAFKAAVAGATAGSDVPQFLAFAESLGFPCLYSSGDPRGQDWPYPWPYPYGPLFALILKAVHAVTCPCWLEAGWDGSTYRVIVDPSWAAALKAVYLAADAAAAALVYDLAGRGRRGVLAALAYYANPINVYVTAVYGMLDPIPIALLLASIAAVTRGRTSLGGVLAGAALAVKQTVLPALAVLAVAAPPLYTLYWASTAAWAYAPTLLCCPGDTGFLKAVLSSLSEPRPPEPLVYSMNGLASIAVLLHRRGAEWALTLLEAWPLAYAALSAAALYAAYRRRSVLAAALLGYAAFTASYWRVNPQYTLGIAALAPAAWATLSKPGKAAAAAASAALAAWGLLYPMGFWARAHMPGESAAAALLDAVTFGPVGDEAYAAVQAVFTLSLYALIAAEAIEAARSRRRPRLPGPQPGESRGRGRRGTGDSREEVQRREEG